MSTFGNMPIEEGSMVDRILDLFKESVLLQSLVTAVLIITCCMLWITERVVPNELLLMTTTVVGFWFGQKNQVVGAKMAKETAYRLATVIEGSKTIPPIPPIPPVVPVTPTYNSLFTNMSTPTYNSLFTNMPTPTIDLK